MLYIYLKTIIVLTHSIKEICKIYLEVNKFYTNTSQTKQSIVNAGIKEIFRSTSKRGKMIMKWKKVLIVILVAFIVFSAMAYLVVRISRGIGLHKGSEKYEKKALDYTIAKLKSDGSYDPNKTYRVTRVYYDGKYDSGDAIPYSKMMFQIGDSPTYIVTMERNDSGEFEITNFETKP